MNSQTERGVKYLVNMKLVVCSCNVGPVNSPCSHQAVIVRHFHISSINCIYGAPFVLKLVKSGDI